MNAITVTEVTLSTDDSAKEEPLSFKTNTGGSVADRSVFERLQPPAPSPLFTGRTKELDFVENLLLTKPEHEAVLIGGSESGKTQFALRLAQLMAVYW